MKSLDPIKLIFGLKLKQFRQEKGWSLQELSELSGISASYLNEIEKGKKYPKTDKILLLSSVLGLEYSELISSDMKKALGPTGDILRSSIFTDVPFEFFGIDPSNLMEIIANAPVKFSALVKTLIKIGRSYNVSVEKLYFAVLRSYTEIHKNYFPDLEEKANRFLVGEEKNEANLKRYLRIEHELIVDTFDPEKFPAISSLRTVFHPKTKRLYLNKNLAGEQRIFALAREAGFRELGIKIRPLTSTWVNVNSFDEVFNNFKASYFASAFLVPHQELNKRIQTLFSQDRFSQRRFNQLLDDFPVTEETLFYRIFSVLPEFFEIEKLYFLKFEIQKESSEPKLIKEIHLVGQHDPQENLNEHYCRRWPGISILEELSPETGRLVKTQVSVFENNGNTYYEIALAKNTKSGVRESITLGFEINESVRKRVGFIGGSPQKTVNQTCEKCALFDCKERVAAPTVLFNERRKAEINKAIEVLTRKSEKLKVETNTKNP